MGSADSQVHKPAEKSKDKDHDRNATLAEKTNSGRSAGHNGMLVSENNRQSFETKSFKYAHELGRKSMDEDRRTSNQLPDKNFAAERKKDGGLVKSAAQSGGVLQETKERTMEKPALDGRMDGRGVIGDARSSGNSLVSNTGVAQNRVAGTIRQPEKAEQKVDGKEKVRRKEGDDRKRDKRKEKDKEKPVLKDKDRENEKKKEEILKAKGEEGIQVTKLKNGSENHMLKPGGKDGNLKDLPVVHSDGFHNITKDSNHQTATVNNNIKKRKDLGLNGIYDGELFLRIVFYCLWKWFH